MRSTASTHLALELLRLPGFSTSAVFYGSIRGSISLVYTSFACVSNHCAARFKTLGLFSELGAEATTRAEKCVASYV